MRFAFGNGLVLLLAVLASGPLRADLFWKVAAQAPLAPQVSLILGDDQRTIAFGTGGTWEFDGTGRVELRRTSGAGRFVAYGVVNDDQTGDGTVFRRVRDR